MASLFGSKTEQTPEPNFEQYESDLDDIAQFAPRAVRLSHVSETAATRLDTAERLRQEPLMAPMEVEPVSSREPGVMTRNQQIAELIISLPYREAMAMGTGILAKLKGSEVSQSAEALTRAIQDWAWEWETFRDEERPKDT
jgi:hypothetical protein